MFTLSNYELSQEFIKFDKQFNEFNKNILINTIDDFNNKRVEILKYILKEYYEMELCDKNKGLIFVLKYDNRPNYMEVWFKWGSKEQKFIVSFELVTNFDLQNFSSNCKLNVFTKFNIDKLKK